MRKCTVVFVLLIAVGALASSARDADSRAPLSGALESAPAEIALRSGLVSDDPVSKPPHRPASPYALASGALRQALERISNGQSPGVDATGGLLRVEVLHSLAASDARAVVAALGGTVEGETAGLVQALIPPGRLVALESVAGVSFVRPPLAVSVSPDFAGNAAPATGVLGAVVGEEVVKMNADDWHTAGITGANVKIGIIDFFGGAEWTASQTAGEVPVPAGTFCRISGADCNIFAVSPGERHGVGVAEIVHEMAPAAKIYLATAGTVTDLQAAEEYFDTQGVAIITRSGSSPYDGPGDGTGPVASIIDSAVADGMTWLNSAGNAAADGDVIPFGGYWRGSWVDVDGNGFLDFAPGDELLGFICDFSSGFRWSDWGINRTDYDLYFFDNPGDAAPFAASIDDQTSGAPPLELQVPCTGDVDYVAVHRYAAGGGSVGDVLEFRVNAGAVEYWQNAYSAAAPAADTASPGALAIGAIDPPNGTGIAPYSSQGPTNDNRTKPDVVAAACVATLVFAPDCFPGTSASTPAVAGALALVMDAGLASTPAAAKSYLLASAVDRGDAGIDNVFGHGELILGTPPVDADLDGVYDGDDNCPAVANADQANLDAANTAANRPGGDALGDACDDDADGDGYTDAAELARVPVENPLSYCTIMRADVDADGVVSILDLTRVASKFTQAIPPAPARYAQDADSLITILDLTRMANDFIQNVSACP